MTRRSRSARRSSTPDGTVVPGSLTRRDSFWRYWLLNDAPWMAGSNGAKHLAVLEVDGEPRAYVVYRLKPDWKDSGPASVATVMDLVGARCRGRAGHVGVGALDRPGRRRALLARARAAPALARDHRAAAAERHRQRRDLVADPGRGGGIGAAARIRVPGRSSSSSPTTICPRTPAGGSSPFRARRRAGVVTRAPESAPSDLSLDISALAATYLGTVRFGDLARAGRVRECRPGAIAAADALWATSISPVQLDDVLEERSAHASNSGIVRYLGVLLWGLTQGRRDGSKAPRRRARGSPIEPRLSCTAPS